MYHYGKEDLVLRESNLGASQRNLKHSDKQLHRIHTLQRNPIETSFLGLKHPCLEGEHWLWRGLMLYTSVQCTDILIYLVHGPRLTGKVGTT